MSDRVDEFLATPATSDEPAAVTALRQEVLEQLVRAGAIDRAQDSYVRRGLKTVFLCSFAIVGIGSVVLFMAAATGFVAIEEPYRGWVIFAAVSTPIGSGIPLVRESLARRRA